MIKSFPKITRTEHTLPFEKLSPIDFERLCYWIVIREGYEDVQHIGAAGKDQGRDIVAKRDGDLIVFQCKRVKELPPSIIKKEVEKNLQFDAEYLPVKLIFMVTCDVNANARIDAQKIAGHKMECLFLCISELDELTNRYPDIVRKFFLPVGEGGYTEEVLPFKCMARPIVDFIERPEYEQAIEKLYSFSKKEIDPEGINIGNFLLLHGAMGFGKSAIAQHLAYDQKIRRSYPDGILWITLGDKLSNAALMTKVLDLLRFWIEKDPPTFESPFSVGSYISQEFNKKKVLLIVDDLCNEIDFVPFEGISQNSTVLITSRFNAILPFNHVEKIKIGPFNSSQAYKLLSQSIDKTNLSKKTLSSIGEKAGNWPLLLKLINRDLYRMIHDLGLDIESALDRTEGRVEKYSSNTISLIGESVDELNDELRNHYLSLAIFPEDTEIPLDILKRYWQKDSLETEDICSKLHHRSLVLEFDLQKNTILLHDVFRKYIIEKAKNKLKELHKHLLEACLPLSHRWTDLPINEHYLWMHLGFHLIKAGEESNLFKLLFNFDYIQSKMIVTSFNRLFCDYELLPRNAELLSVQRALSNSAEYLSKDKDCIAFQLIGRLIDVKGENIKRLLHEAGKWRQATWLRPRNRTFWSSKGHLVRTIDAHQTSITSLSIFNQQQILSVSLDGLIRIWDINTWELVFELNPSIIGVNSAKLLGDGKIILGTIEGAIYICNIFSKDKPQIIGKHNASVRSIAILGEDKLVSASEDLSLCVWDINKAIQLQSLKGHSSPIRSMQPIDQNRILAGTADGTIRLWDISQQEALKVFTGHSSSVTNVSLIDIDKFASASADSTIRIWNIESAETILLLRPHRAPIRDIAVIDNYLIISASHDRTICITDIKADKVKTKKLYGHANWVRKVVALSDHQFISGTVDGILGVWDTSSWKIPGPKLSCHGDWIRDVTFIDDQRVASGSDDNTVIIWDVVRGVPLWSFSDHDDWVRSIKLINENYLISASDDGSIKVIDLKQKRSVLTLKGHSHWVRSVDLVSPNRLVSSSCDRTIRLWDLTNANNIKIFKGKHYHSSTLKMIDNNRIVTASVDWNLYLWNLEDQKVLKVLKGHGAWITKIIFIPEKLLISSSYDKTIRIFDINTGNNIRTLKGHTSEVNDVSLIDNEHIISSSFDGTLRIWNISNGKCVAIINFGSIILTTSILKSNPPIIIAGGLSGYIYYFDFIKKLKGQDNHALHADGNSAALHCHR